MYEKKIGKAYGRGCLIQLLAGAGGGLLALVMLGVVLWLIDGGRVEPRSPRLALALAMPFVMISVPLGIGGIVVWLRKRRLDRAFAPLGLSGRQWSGVMRSWQGEVGGRRLDAWFHKGPTLELYLDCRPGCRGVIHRGGRLIRAIERQFGATQPLAPPPFDLDGASFYGSDPEWLGRLLERPEAEAAVRELMRETDRTAAAVFFAPDAVRYMRRFFPVREMTADGLHGWLDSLERLAAAVDAAGPAAEDAVPTRLEGWARRRRGRLLRKVLLGIAGVGVSLLLLLYLFALLNVGTP